MYMTVITQQDALLEDLYFSSTFSFPFRFTLIYFSMHSTSGSNLRQSIF
jgi:hypothetical protein